MSKDDVLRMTDVEAAKTAVGVEERGFELYSGASRCVKAPATRRLFQELAEAEQKHRERFEGIEQRLLLLEEAPYWDDPDVTAYIRALVDPGVFPPLPANLENPREVLLYALRVEQLSVLFYDGVAQNAYDAPARRVFAEIREEEKTHVVRVAGALRACSGAA